MCILFEVVFNFFVFSSPQKSLAQISGLVGCNGDPHTFHWGGGEVHGEEATEVNHDKEKIQILVMEDECNVNNANNIIGQVQHCCRAKILCLPH